MANANVKNTIIIAGVDNASNAIDKARKSLGLLEDQANKTDKATAALADGGNATKTSKAVQELSGDLEGALKGVADFGGGANAALSGLAERAGAAEAIMRLLPGPIGLAATATVALALGAKLLADNASESEAKLRLLVSGPVKDLAKDLKLDADGAVALQQAFDSLDPGTIRPSIDLLKQVGENAKSLGGEPKQAMLALAEGFKGSDRDVAQLLGKVGSLGVEVQSLDAIAKSLGFDNAALGLTAAKTSAEQLKKIEEDIRVARANADASEANRRVAQATFEGNAANQTNKAFLDRYSNTIATADADKRLVQSLEEGAVAIKDQIQDEILHKETVAQVAKIKANAALDASLAANDEAAKNIRIQASKSIQALLGDALAKSSFTISAWAGKEAESRADALATMQKQNALEDKQRVESEKAQARAKAQAAASAANAKAQEERARKLGILDDKLRTNQARAEEGGVVTLEKRLKLIDQEQAKAVAALSTKEVDMEASTEKLKAIDAEARTKRQKAIDEDKAKNDKANEDSAKKKAELAKQSEAIVITTNDSIAKSNATVYAEETERIRAAGQEEVDIAREVTAAKVAYEQELIKIKNDLIIAKRAEGLSEKDLAQLDLGAKAKRIEAASRLASIESDLAAKKRQDVAKQIADGAGIFENAAGAIGGNLGDGLSALASGTTKVAGEWANLSLSAESAIGASGAVAAAFVDDEKDKAKIMAATEGAQAIASFASGNLVAGAGHTAAALAFGAIGGGFVGGSSASSGGGQATAPQSTSTGTLGGVGNGQAQGGGGNTINVVLGRGFVVGTPGQVGKGVANALGGLKNTGIKMNGSGV